MTTFFASGPLLNDDVVLGTPEQIVDRLIELHIPGSTADRTRARRAIAIAICEEIQAALLTAPWQRKFGHSKART